MVSSFFLPLARTRSVNWDWGQRVVQGGQSAGMEGRAWGAEGSPAAPGHQGRPRKLALVWAVKSGKRASPRAEGTDSPETGKALLSVFSGLHLGKMPKSFEVEKLV